MSSRADDDLNSEYAAEIGRIAVAWSAVELSINYMIWAIAGVPEGIGACLTSQIYTLDGRIKALISLLRLKGGPESLITQLNKFSEDARGVGEQRNRIVHDAWGWDTYGTVARLEITAPKRLKFEVVRTSLTELREVSQTIKKFARRTQDLRKDFYAALPSLPKIPESKLRPITDPLLDR